MKKLIIPVIALFVCLAVLSACGKSGTPDCSDSDVKKKVVDVVSSAVKTNLLASEFPVALIAKYGPPDYEKWNKLKDKNEDIKKVIDQVNEEFAKYTITLTGIKKVGKDDEINLCKCSGNLTSSDGNDERTVNIKYSAKRREDGKLFVQLLE